MFACTVFLALQDNLTGFSAEEHPDMDMLICPPHLLPPELTSLQIHSLVWKYKAWHPLQDETDPDSNPSPTSY